MISYMTQTTQQVKKTVTMIDGHPASVIQDYVGTRLTNMHENPEKAGLTISGFLDNIRYMLDVAFLDLDDDYRHKFADEYDGYKSFMMDVMRYSEGFVSAEASVLEPPPLIWVKIVVELAFKYIVGMFEQASKKNKINTTVLDGWTRLSAKCKGPN